MRACLRVAVCVWGPLASDYLLPSAAAAASAAAAVSVFALTTVRACVCVAVCVCVNTPVNGVYYDNSQASSRF